MQSRPPLTPLAVASLSWCVHPRHLKKIHGRLVRLGLHRSNPWLATLISLCSRLSLPLYARRLLSYAPAPDLLVFTAMIKLYADKGTGGFALYVSMQHAGIRPDAFVFPALLRSIASSPPGIYGPQGRALHACVIMFGHHSDRYVQNAVMDMYGKSGQISLAAKLFGEIPRKNLADWNVMLSGYCRKGDLKTARQLFFDMPERNVVSWTAMVSGYAKCGDLENARRVFDEMTERSAVSWNAMLSGYTQGGHVEEALKLFNQMVDAGVRPDETTLTTAISICAKRANPELAGWLVSLLETTGIVLNCFVRTAMVDMYAKCGNLVAARTIFDDMPEKNPVSWNAMIAGYAKGGDIKSARELFDKMPEKNLVSWNSMITGYTQNGHCEDAILLFKEMTEINRLKPDDITMASIFSACGHLGGLDLANWVKDYVKNKAINLSISSYNSMIHMYARCGNMEEAVKVFDEMTVRDVISCNALIAGFAAHGQAAQTLRLLSEMQEAGIQPDRITFMGVLTACSHGGLVDEGHKVFESIKKTGTPSVDHYACVVDLLGRAGRLDEARSLIEEMPIRPHAGVYGALLNACRLYKAVTVAEFAARKLFELEPENPGNYILLSNIYANASRWHDVERVRKMMKEKGMSKTTACSWVESDRKTHRFIVGDRAHPRSNEIYQVLEEMKKKMMDLGYEPDKTWSLRDVEDEEKEELVGVHSERLAIAFGLLISPPGNAIKVVKNLRVCVDCHAAIKIISKITEREIIMRDNTRFHHFKNGTCSCTDYW